MPQRPGRLPLPDGLRDHPDRLRWNARYASTAPQFTPHPLVAVALAAGMPDGPVLELACGRSGSALELAAAGRGVIAVDVSDVAIADLAAEAERRGLSARIDCVLADVPSYDPGAERFALVLATYFWDEAAFRAGCAAVLPGGLLGWEARSPGPDGPRHPWEVTHGTLSAQLPERFEVLDERPVVTEAHRSTRLLARAAGG
jgi:SAM-dependent methyltransferase